MGIKAISILPEVMLRCLINPTPLRWKMLRLLNKGARGTKLYIAVKTTQH